MDLGDIMIDNFKINCYQLNRAIRVSINLPKNYNITGKYYPLIYFFDGQNLYNEKESLSTEVLDLETVKTRLSEDGKEAIYVGIAAANNPERRNTEYENTVLAEFIHESIQDFLKSRYRINDYIYAVGCGKSALNALMLNQYDDFKGTVLLSPEINIMNLIRLDLNINNLYYIYCGKNELNGKCLNEVEQLKTYLPNAKIELDDNDIHSENAWKNKLYNALSYLIL